MSAKPPPIATDPAQRFVYRSRVRCPVCDSFKHDVTSGPNPGPDDTLRRYVTCKALGCGHRFVIVDIPED